MSEIDLLEASMSGRDLTARQAEKLERALRENPDDAVSRAQLCCYYSTKQRDLHRQRHPHALWFIEHFPEDPIIPTPFVQVFRRQSRRAYERARTLWGRHLRRTESAETMHNAARFFLLDEPARAHQILRRALRIDPGHDGAARTLARSYLNEARSSSGAQRRRAARLALAVLDEQQARERSPRSRWYELRDVGYASLLAGDREQASRVADQLLEGAKQFTPDWNCGNAVHHAHVILGHLALLDADHPAAAKQLIEAGRTEGSPQLNSFGPDFELAADVLKVGQRDAVLEYLRLVQGFWQFGRADVRRWTREVRKTGRCRFDRRFA